MVTRHQFLVTRIHTYALRITPNVPPVGESLSYEWERSCALAMLQSGIPIDVLMRLCTASQEVSM
ncbi:MAG: hypothetical protein MUF71_01190 [Candidatus Kapabacteria bacterium]|jgi:hypothetical protein|nr:hypothetical protein [Candidatus Kapabacteria bacterium]